MKLDAKDLNLTWIFYISLLTNIVISLNSNNQNIFFDIHFDIQGKKVHLSKICVMLDVYGIGNVKFEIGLW